MDEKRIAFPNNLTCNVTWQSPGERWQPCNVAFGIPLYMLQRIDGYITLADAIAAINMQGLQTTGRILESGTDFATYTVRFEPLRAEILAGVRLVYGINSLPEVVETILNVVAIPAGEIAKARRMAAFTESAKGFLRNEK